MSGAALRAGCECPLASAASAGAASGSIGIDRPLDGTRGTRLALVRFSASSE